MLSIAAGHDPANAATYNTKAAQFDRQADQLLALVQQHRWDSDDEFFKTGYKGANVPANSADINTQRFTSWSPNDLASRSGSNAT